MNIPLKGTPGDNIKKTVIESFDKEFSSCFRLQLSDPCEVDGVIFETCIRYFLHNERLECSKVEKSSSTNVSQSLVLPDWKCTGLCGLKSSRIDLLRKKKRSVISAIRRKISRQDS